MLATTLVLISMVGAAPVAPAAASRMPLPRTGVGFLADLSFGDDVARALPPAGPSPPSFGVILDLQWRPDNLESTWDEATLREHPDLRSVLTSPKRFAGIVDSLEGTCALILRAAVPAAVPPAPDGSSYHPSHDDMLHLLEESAAKYGPRVAAWLVMVWTPQAGGAEARLASIEEVARTIRGKDPGARIVLDVSLDDTPMPAGRPGLVDGYLVRSNYSAVFTADVSALRREDPAAVVWTDGWDHPGRPAEAWDRRLTLRDNDVPFGVNLSLWNGEGGSPDRDLQWSNEMTAVLAAYARAFAPDSARIDGGSCVPANMRTPGADAAPRTAPVRFKLPTRAYGRWSAHRASRDGATRVILRSDWVGWTGTRRNDCQPTPDPPPTAMRATWVRLDPGWMSASLIDPLGPLSGPLQLDCGGGSCRVLVPRVDRPVVIELVPAR